MFIKRSSPIIVYILLVLISVPVLTTSTVFAAPRAVTTKTTQAPYTQADIISATNKARKTAGLNTVTTDEPLTRAAQKKADDMAKNSYFSHESPSGMKFWTLISEEGYAYMNAGENLAVHHKSTLSLMTAWLESPSHRANILGTQYTDIGIGIAYGERKGFKGWYVVQLFGSK